jgi:hypothetical protein
MLFVHSLGCSVLPKRHEQQCPADDLLLGLRAERSAGTSPEKGEPGTTLCELSSNSSALKDRLAALRNTIEEMEPANTAPPMWCSGSLETRNFSSEWGYPLSA